MLINIIHTQFAVETVYMEGWCARMRASLFCFILPKATECESVQVLLVLQIENSWFSECSSSRTC